MASAGSITWDLAANSAKFVQALNKANKAGKSWGDRMASTAKSAATHFASAGAAVAKTAAATAAAAAASLSALYTVTSGNIDEQAKFADKIGLTTDALGGLQHAADLTGVSTENMNLGLQRMTRRVAEAAQGTGTAVEALDALNLSAQDLNQLSPDEQFLAIADAMGEVEGRSEQVRLAFKLFDSGGVALLNTMDMASDGIRDAMEQAEHLGIALNRIDAAQVENANDAFDVMTKVSAGVARQITVAFAPAVEHVSNKVTQLALDTEWFGEIGTMAFDAVVKVISISADALHGYRIYLSGLQAGFLELAAVAAESMTDCAETVAKVLNATVGNIGDLIRWVLDQLSSLVARGEKLPGRAGEWARDFSAVLEEMGKSVQENLTFDESGVIEGIGAIREAADDALVNFTELADTEFPSSKIQAVANEWQKVSRESAEAAANTKKYNEVIEEIESDIVDSDEALTSFWERLKENIEETTNNFDSMWGNTFDRFTSNFSSAFSSAIVDGESFNDSMKKIAAGFSRTMIAALTEIATKQLVLWAMQKTILRAKTVEASVNAYSSTAAIPIIGPGLAPAAGASALAATKSIISGIAHSGISEIPKEGTWLLDRNERVLSSKQNKDLTDFLKNKEQTQEQVIYSPTIMVEAGASQDQDVAFAEMIINEVFNRLVTDGRVNGPVRRAMNG